MVILIFENYCVTVPFYNDKLPKVILYVRSL